jgi:hypothetical protein
MTLRDVDTTSEYDLGEGYLLTQIDLTATLDVSVDTDGEDRPRYEWTVVRFTVQGSRFTPNRLHEKKDFQIGPAIQPELFTVLRLGLDDQHIREQLHQQDQDHF